MNFSFKYTIIASLLGIEFTKLNAILSTILFQLFMQQFFWILFLNKTCFLYTDFSFQMISNSFRNTLNSLYN